MTEANQPDNGITESVYRMHKSKILNEFSSTDRHINQKIDVRYPQGHYTDQVKDYATSTIAEEDASNVRCGSLRSIDYLCKSIASKEDIPNSKVYPAMRLIGYNIRYHNLKCGNPDSLYEIGALVKECRNTFILSIVSIADNTNLFPDATSSVYRMRTDAIAIAMKDADYSGIKVSELNLYNVLEGINTLVENEPDYNLLKDSRIVRAPLDILMDTKEVLKHKCASLKAVLANR